MFNSSLDDFQNIIGYRFNNIELLKLALTHSSYGNEHRKERYENNERVEFLGDAALDLIISRYIYDMFPFMPEGELTKLRAGVVCETSLAKVAVKLNIGEFLMLGKGEENTGGRSRESILADAVEAVIGAIYIDGGFDSVEKFVINILADAVEELKTSFRTIDCKTHLQEVIQKTSKSPISYVIIDEKGPDHNKVFVAEVRHGGKVIGMGSGRSKKEAEQSAAADALNKTEEKNVD